MTKNRLNWAKTGTLQTMGEWTRCQADALVLMAVRPGDAVLLVEPGRALLDVEEAVRRCVPQLVAAIGVERRRNARMNHAGVTHPRIQWLRDKAKAICVLAIRKHNSVLLVDGLCKPEDAGQLLLECLPRLAAEFGKSTKYCGARLVLEPCQE